jgi:O-antigen/teichoic acid export membrane protein
LDLTASLFAAASAAIGLVIFSNVIGVDGVSLFALIVGCLSLIAGVAGTPKGYFRLKGRFAVLALNQTIGSFLTLCGSLALWQAEANISSYVIVLCLLNALPPVMLLARMVASAKQNRVMIESPLKPGLRRRFLRLVARLSVGNSILSIVLTSRYQISLFIVSSLLGSSSAGLFAAASRCANVFSRALSPIVQVLFPELAREMASTGGTRLRMPGSFLSAIFLLCVVLSSVGAVLFGPEILRAAAGDEFAAAGHAFGFLFATELAMFCSAVISAIVLHMYGQKRLVLLGVTAASISHLSSLSVARSLGIEGVSLSLLVGALLSLTVSGFLVHRGFLNRT